MASALHNLSSYDPTTVPSGKGYKIGIVVSEWNEEVTGALLEGAYNTLLRHDVEIDDIIVKTVPGSFELVYAAASMMDYTDVDAIIAIGCVIRGDTPHFDYICQMCACGHRLSHIRLFATPWTVAHKAPPSNGIFQARILE